MTPNKAETIQPPSRSLSNLQKTTQSVEQILRDLGDEKLWPDEKIADLRGYATTLSIQTWRVECACDAELLKRSHARRGRGNVDVDQKGVRAVVNQVASRLEVSSRTVFLNAQLHNTFFQENRANVCTNLEKAFYIAALTADEPFEALEQIIEAKADNPDFSVRDAKRLIRHARHPTVALQPIEALQDFQREVVKEHLEEAITAIRKLVEKCPSPPIATQYNRWLSWLMRQKERTPEKDQQRILNVIPRGCNTPEDIADETDMDESEVRVYLDALVAAGAVIARRKGGETDVARGARITLYFLQEEAGK